MKVAIITTSGISNPTNGIGRYSFELINNIKNADKDIEVLVLSPKKDGNFLTVLFFSLIILPFKLLTLKADIYHTTSPDECIFPIIMKKNTIVTVHDMIYISHPEGTKFLKRLYFRICSYFFRRASLIITNSQYSKKEIVRYLKIPSSKVFYTYFGINSKFKAIKSIKREKLIGYLGGSAKRKNVSTLIKAFSLLKKQGLFKDYKLVLGINKNEELENLVKELKVKNVNFLGNIKEDKILDFYNSLSLFVYPSLYEGFGFPPLEAMSCGCPVICSKRASIPEVVGDAAIKINPNKPEEIYLAIKNLISNYNNYQQFRKEGLLQANKYSWNTTIKL